MRIDVPFDHAAGCSTPYPSACWPSSYPMEPPDNRMEARGGVNPIRLEVVWKCMLAKRGGWQGSQLMMNTFALGLEETFQLREHLLLLLKYGIARLGYADDLRLYSKCSAFSSR